MITGREIYNGHIFHIQSAMAQIEAQKQAAKAKDPERVGARKTGAKSLFGSLHDGTLDREESWDMCTKKMSRTFLVAFLNIFLRVFISDECHAESVCGCGCFFFPAHETSPRGNFCQISNPGSHRRVSLPEAPNPPPVVHIFNF